MFFGRFFINWLLLIIGLVGAIYYGKTRWGRKGAWIMIAVYFLLVVITVAIFPIMAWYFLPLGT